MSSVEAENFYQAQFGANRVEENMKSWPKKGCVFDDIYDVPGPENPSDISIRSEAKVYERTISMIYLLAMKETTKYKIKLSELEDKNKYKF
jgi:hypothetical protein